MPLQRKSPFMKVTLPADTRPIDASRGVWAFSVVHVPKRRGYTGENVLLDGTSAWPVTEEGQFLVFDNAADADAWREAEEGRGPDWTRWRAVT